MDYHVIVDLLRVESMLKLNNEFGTPNVEGGSEFYHATLQGRWTIIFN
jgi:hypothetical protein